MQAESSEEEIREICEQIYKSYGESFVKDAFSLILLLLGNILKNPNDAKYKTFKKTNNAIKTKILIIPETIQLMQVIGYSEQGSDVLIFQGSDVNLQLAMIVLQEYIDQINKFFEEQELLAKQKAEEDVKRNIEEVNKKFKQKKIEEQKILEQLENDKKERSKKEKPCDSMGKELSYGAKEVKLPPPKKGG